MSLPMRVACRARYLASSRLGSSSTLAAKACPQWRQLAIQNSSWKAIPAPNARFATLTGSARTNDSVQKVRIRSWRRYRLGTYALVAICVTIYFQSIVKASVRILEALPEELEEDAEDEVQLATDVDGNEVPIKIYVSIPLSWPKALPRTFYKGSDPEWAEFVKLSRNEAKKTMLIQNVIKDVAAHISRQLPALKIIGGSKDISLGKYMLDITFPAGPPQEYSRWILLFHDGGVATAIQSISNEDYTRLYRTLWPADTVKAVKTFFKILWSYHYMDLKGTVGIKPEKGTSEYHLAMVAERLQINMSKLKGTSSVKSNTATPPSIRAEGNGSQVKLPGSGKTARDDKTDTDSTSPNDRPFWMAPFSQRWMVHNRVAAAFVLAGLQRNNNHSIPKQPPRGAVQVSGLVEAKGERGVATLYIKAYSDPETGECSGLSAQIASIKPWKQSPLGGP